MAAGQLYLDEAIEIWNRPGSSINARLDAAVTIVNELGTDRDLARLCNIVNRGGGIRDLVNTLLEENS